MHFHAKIHSFESVKKLRNHQYFIPTIARGMTDISLVTPPQLYYQNQSIVYKQRTSIWMRIEYVLK